MAQVTEQVDLVTYVITSSRSSPTLTWSIAGTAHGRWQVAQDRAAPGVLGSRRDQAVRRPHEQFRWFGSDQQDAFLDFADAELLPALAAAAPA